MTRKMARGECKDQCVKLGPMYTCAYAGETMQDGYREPLKFNFMPPVPPRLPPRIPPMPEPPQKPKKPPGFNFGRAALQAGLGIFQNVASKAMSGGYSRPKPKPQPKATSGSPYSFNTGINLGTNKYKDAFSKGLNTNIWSAKSSSLPKFDINLGSKLFSKPSASSSYSFGGTTKFDTKLKSNWYSPKATSKSPYSFNTGINLGTNKYKDLFSKGFNTNIWSAKSSSVPKYNLNLGSKFFSKPSASSSYSFGGTTKFDTKLKSKWYSPKATNWYSPKATSKSPYSFNTGINLGTNKYKDLFSKGFNTNIWSAKSSSVPKYNLNLGSKFFSKPSASSSYSFGGTTKFDTKLKSKWYSPKATNWYSPKATSKSPYSFNTGIDLKTKKYKDAFSKSFNTNLWSTDTAKSSSSTSPSSSTFDLGTKAFKYKFDTKSNWFSPKANGKSPYSFNSGINLKTSFDTGIDLKTKKYKDAFSKSFNTNFWSTDTAKSSSSTSPSSSTFDLGTKAFKYDWTSTKPDFKYDIKLDSKSSKLFNKAWSSTNLNSKNLWGNSKAFNQPFTFDTNLNLNHHGNPATSVVDDIKARGAGKRQITEAQANDPAFVKQYGDYYTGSNGQKRVYATHIDPRTGQTRNYGWQGSHSFGKIDGTKNGHQYVRERVVENFGIQHEVSAVKADRINEQRRKEQGAKEQNRKAIEAAAARRRAAAAQAQAAATSRTSTAQQATSPTQAAPTPKATKCTSNWCRLRQWGNNNVVKPFQEKSDKSQELLFYTGTWYSRFNKKWYSRFNKEWYSRFNKE